MTPIVVDASVGIKWFLPEVHAAEARLWRNASVELHVPASFFDLEIANVLWKKVQREELTSDEAGLVLAQLDSLPLIRHPEPGLIAAAFDLANRTRQTVYDCVYMALAIGIGGQMLTADQRLCNSLANTPWASSVHWVADGPSGQ